MERTVAGNGERMAYHKEAFRHYYSIYIQTIDHAWKKTLLVCGPPGHYGARKNC